MGSSSLATSMVGDPKDIGSSSVGTSAGRLALTVFLILSRTFVQSMVVYKYSVTPIRNNKAGFFYKRGFY
jgi:hypothetical protein